jgi:hypothetical protein
MDNKKITPISKSYKLYGIYCPCSSELRYIGITTGLLTTRLSGHLRKPTNGKIALWFKELQKDNKKPIIKLIREYETYSDLLLGEINEIKENRENNINLLNIADGGYINPMFGKTHTKEARLKISINNKGLKRSEEQIEERKKLLTRLWSDKEWSDNLKIKMSENMLGNKRALGFKHSEETKSLISNLHKGNKYNLGYKHELETLKKMSENNSGENNPMYGKTLPKEVLLKRSEKVKREGTFKGENNPNFKFKINKEELYDLYITKNLNIGDISKIYGCHRTVISHNIKKHSIKKETSNKYNINLYDIKNYLLNGLSQVDIASIYGCSNTYINKIIRNKLN